MNILYHKAEEECERDTEEKAGCKMWHALILSSTLWWQWERVSAKMRAHRETQLQNDSEQEEGTMETKL